MNSHLPSRLCLGAAFMLLFAVAPARARQQKSSPPPVMAKPSRIPPPPRAENRPENRPATNEAAGRAAAQNQQHLQRWMESHSRLSLPEQQRALQNEPGFRELPSQVQQHELNQLGRLYSMSPQQRTQILQRNELLEHLSQTQRQQFRSGMEQYNYLPPDRKTIFRKAFRDLRQMPPSQRQQVIDSPAFRAQFSENERSALSSVLAVEPYPPVRAPNEAP